MPQIGNSGVINLGINNTVPAEDDPLKKYPWLGTVNDKRWVAQQTPTNPSVELDRSGYPLMAPVVPPPPVTVGADVLGIKPQVDLEAIKQRLLQGAKQGAASLMGANPEPNYHQSGVLGVRG